MTDDAATILVVEDDLATRTFLADNLTADGYEVLACETARDALRRLEASAPDLLLLDLGLPDLDGYEVCRRVRAASDVPIIVVTARSEEVDRVVGLELGADDYLVKPFGFRELVARIRAVTRRVGAREPEAREPEAQALRVGPLEVDRRTHRARIGGRELDLTPKEFDLLALLAADPGAVQTRQDILETVWDPHWYGPTKTLDVHVASLRRKMGDPGWIETVRGVGFRLRSGG